MKRRQFLSQSSLLLATPLGLFLKGTLASALVQQKPLRRYVQIGLLGANPRWVFDNFVNPLGESSYRPNQMIGSRIVNATTGELGYETLLNSGYQVPWLWKYDVAAPKTGRTPMSSLLDHMLTIQGINMETDGHAPNLLRMNHPVATESSMNGLVAEASSSPIGAASLDSFLSDSFLSTLGGSQTYIRTLGLADPLSTMVKAYQKPSTSVLRKNLAPLVDHAIDVLQKSQRAQGNRSNYLEVNRKQAQAIMEKSYVSLTSVYEALVAKYRDLIARSLAPVGLLYPSGIPGISDAELRVPSSTAAKAFYRIGADKTWVNPANANLLSIFGPTTELPGVAEYFAVTEFLLSEGLGNSIVFGVDSFSGQGIANLGVIDELGGSQPFTLSLDQHQTGKVSSLLVNSMFFRGLSACLIELISVVKQSGTFENTVIQLNSEMGRNANTDGSGTQHGWEGSISSIWSGALPPGLQVAGKIRADADGSGTWGYGAPTVTSILGQTATPVTLEYLGATVAHILGGYFKTNVGRSLLGPGLVMDPKYKTGIV